MAEAGGGSLTQTDQQVRNKTEHENAQGEKDGRHLLRERHRLQNTGGGIRAWSDGQAPEEGAVHEQEEIHGR